MMCVFVVERRQQNGNLCAHNLRKHVKGDILNRETQTVPELYAANCHDREDIDKSSFMNDHPPFYHSAESCNR